MPSFHQDSKMYTNSLVHSRIYEDFTFSFTQMPPRNTVMDYAVSPSDDQGNDYMAPGEITPAITEETHAQKRPKTVIVWRNVILMLLLHVSAVYSLILIPKAHPLTWVWGMFLLILYKYDPIYDKMTTIRQIRK